MTEEVRPNFLESVEFLDDTFYPFKSWKPIIFWGEKEGQRMIEFYLKNKWIENYKENAKRFKINCVLGNNWGGKSRLFEWIYHYFLRPNYWREPYWEKYLGNIKIWDFNISFPNNYALPYFMINWKESKPLPTTTEMQNFLILNDDFFKLSGNIYNSVNKDILSNDNLNKFYLNIYNFLNWDKSGQYKKIFNEFLNLNQINLSINFSFQEDWYRQFGWDYLYFSETENKENSKWFINSQLSDNYNDIKILFEKLIDWNEFHEILWKEYCEHLLLSISDLFIYYINQSRNNINFQTSQKNLMFLYDNIDDKIKSSTYEDFIQSLYLFQKYLWIIEKYIKKWDIKFSEYEDILSNYTSFSKVQFNTLKTNLSHVISIFEGLEKSEKTGKIELKKYFPQQNLHNFLRTCSGYEYTYLNQTDFFILNLIDGFQTESWKEIETQLSMPFQNFIYHQVKKTIQKKIKENTIGFSKDYYFYHDLCVVFGFPIFNIDISFWEKTFENLSAWEKTMLIRFTNIYEKILLEKVNWKTVFLILIDEPDLHLHLDWQRQYIQKLIDVFSTLDPEISLHFIIATHSPFIISDLPQKSLVLLENWKQIEYEWETFWANYIDIIKNGFFFDKKKFMWSFAEEVIGEVAQSKRKELLDIPNGNDRELTYEIEKNIWDKFLKNNLVYFKSEKYDKGWN